MIVGIDASPLHTGNYKKHRVRGTGFYISHLLNAMRKYFPEHTYVEYNKGGRSKKLFDVNHIPYFEPFFLSIPYPLQKRSVLTIHDLTPLIFPENFPSGTKGSVIWQIQKRLAKKAGAIITDSESSKNDILRLTGVSQENIHVIYLAAGEEFVRMKPTREQKELLKRKYNIPDRFLLYVGDATWNKNLPRLLTVIEQTKIPIVLVGKALADTTVDQFNPWNEDLLQVQSRSTGNKLITLTGFVPTDELILLYNLAELFVMPSLYEGFGLPVLEAMQCGVPVVSSNGGSLPEVVGNACLLFDPTNDKQMAKAIKEVWNSGELRKTLSEKSIMQAKKFSWKKVAKETIDVYQHLFLSNDTAK